MNLALAVLCPRRPLLQPKASLTAPNLYPDVSSSEKSSLTTSCHVLSLLTWFAFLRNAYFSLDGICSLSLLLDESCQAQGLL